MQALKEIGEIQNGYQPRQSLAIECEADLPLSKQAKKRRNNKKNKAQKADGQQLDLDEKIQKSDIKNEELKVSDEENKEDSTRSNSGNRENVNFKCSCEDDRLKMQILN